MDGPDITQETPVTHGEITSEQIDTYEPILPQNRIMELRAGLTLYEAESGALDLLLVKAKLLATEKHTHPGMPEITDDMLRFVGDVEYCLRTGEILVDSNDEINPQELFEEVATRLSELTAYDATEDAFSLLREQVVTLTDELKAERERADPDVIELEHRVLTAEARAETADTEREKAEAALADQIRRNGEKDLQIALISGEIPLSPNVALDQEDEPIEETTLPEKIAAVAVKSGSYVRGIVVHKNK